MVINEHESPNIAFMVIRQGGNVRTILMEQILDWLELLERYGVPLVVAVAFWMFIQKQNKFIQDELQKELRESFTRVEGIIVKLIDQQKKMQLEQKGIEQSYRTLVEVIAKLSGNGLKDKFLRMQERNENKKY